METENKANSNKEVDKYSFDKKTVMRRIAKEGHSFLHYDTCSTCEEDFDEVFSLGIQEGKKIQREVAESYVQDILKNDIFLNKLDAEGLVLKIKELAKVKQEAFENGIITGKQELWGKLWKLINLDSVDNLMTMDMSKARILLENEGVELV